MTECRICGNEFRDGEDVVDLGHEVVHHDCADPPHGDEQRRVEQWGKLGSTNQLRIGDVQRDK